MTIRTWRVIVDRSDLKIWESKMYKAKVFVERDPDIRSPWFVSYENYLGVHNDIDETTNRKDAEKAAVEWMRQVNDRVLID